MDVKTADETEVVVQIQHGPRYIGRLDRLEIRWEAYEEIGEALLAGKRFGEFDCGGQHYTWCVGD